MARSMIGKVVSSKMELTATVSVTRTKEHPIYRKKYHVSSKFLAHNPDNTYKEGMTVEIIETKPTSARKRWLITREVKAGEVTK